MGMTFFRSAMALKKELFFAFLGCMVYTHLISAAVPANRSESTIDGMNLSEIGRNNNSVCWVNNTSYSNDDIVPKAGPCEQCICEASVIVCSTIKCEIKAGCKIIQKQNRCCPDYQCDCEFNGRVYNNGDKIETINETCKICYCKGGDVMCTSIACYKRDDCEGKMVTGSCCPAYDHCPPLNTNDTIHLVKEIAKDPGDLTDGLQPWLLTTKSPVDLPNTPISPETVTEDRNTTISSTVVDILDDFATSILNSSLKEINEAINTIKVSSTPSILNDTDLLTDNTSLPKINFAITATNVSERSQTTSENTDGTVTTTYITGQTESLASNAKIANITFDTTKISTLDDTQKNALLETDKTETLFSTTPAGKSFDTRSASGEIYTKNETIGNTTNVTVFVVQNIQPSQIQPEVTTSNTPSVNEEMAYSTTIYSTKLIDEDYTTESQNATLEDGVSKIENLIKDTNETHIIKLLLTGNISMTVNMANLMNTAGVQFTSDGSNATKNSPASDSDYSATTTSSYVLGNENNGSDAVVPGENENVSISWEDLDKIEVYVTAADEDGNPNSTRTDVGKESFEDEFPEVLANVTLVKQQNTSKYVDNDEEMQTQPPCTNLLTNNSRDCGFLGNSINKNNSLSADVNNRTNDTTDKMPNLSDENEISHLVITTIKDSEMANDFTSSTEINQSFKTIVLKPVSNNSNNEYSASSETTKLVAVSTSSSNSNSSTSFSRK